MFRVRYPCCAVNVTGFLSASDNMATYRELMKKRLVAKTTASRHYQRWRRQQSPRQGSRKCEWDIHHTSSSSSSMPEKNLSRDCSTESKRGAGCILATSVKEEHLIRGEHGFKDRFRVRMRVAVGMPGQGLASKGLFYLLLGEKRRVYVTRLLDSQRLHGVLDLWSWGSGT
ncbi:hypothetical protein PsorP6_014466 [Peronosclerospora sorghi]|uniref:Uncharacterized protein n=1 Tax=Peronosclerospora sorghi TaxID=230839 RepID=A0ACC0VS65_9STRA|nr:hypothetical protein PsorP6_014466 [Peronosclerospora sorghi]